MFSRKIIKDYFIFGKRDRIGLIVLVGVLAGSIFLPRIMARKSSFIPVKEDLVLKNAIDTLQNRQTATKKYGRRETGYAYQNNNYQYEASQKTPFTNGELFPFDPNTILAADWQRMGLNEKTSKTIEKYTSKGGRFYKPEDLQKIWGMPDGFYERVKDFVTIASTKKDRWVNNYENKSFAREERKIADVNINEADTAVFIALPGIGSKLSARIIAFREKLGGFYSIDQVGETYGLPDSAFQKIRPHLQLNGDEVRKININTATKDELKVHPYIRWNLANAIVEYRNQHGNYKNLEDVRNIVVIDEATYKKIAPYLSL